MPTIDRARVLEYFHQHPERPWHVQDVQEKLTIDDKDDLKEVLDALVASGDLIRTRRRSYGLPKDMNLVGGRLQVTSGGYGFVIADERATKDMFVPSDKLIGAWDGDRVLARPDPGTPENGKPSGEVVRIVARGHDQVVGTLEYARGYAILRPDSVRLRERVLLAPESVGAIEAGTRIVGRMVWPEASGEKEPFAEVSEVLGVADDPEVETRAVIVKYGLEDEFGEDVLAEAAAFGATVPKTALRGRTDHRGVPTFTIDGADAKDFDDALSVERTGGRGKAQRYRIGVHIADVSHYVVEGSVLDESAKARATSVYLPGRVLPMLPEALSNGLCSLVEGEDRLALSCFVEIDREGVVHGVSFAESVIRSDARLTYDHVQAFAEGDRLPEGKRKLERDVKVLLDLAEVLRAARIGAGALDFDFTEAKVDVDEQGDLHLTPIRSNAARRLVEEMMLLANRLVAKELHEADVPTLYRVHEDPSTEKVQALQKALQRLGYEVDLDDPTPADLQRVLKQAAGKPEQQMVSVLLLRSLKQARYAADNLGHFGLAFEHYLHFTSPIRRYPDLIVHRVLRARLRKKLTKALQGRWVDAFPGLADHVSERERKAEEAERDLTKYFHAVWARDHVGERFTATVSGVTNFGVFLALPNGIEGLMHVSQLDDDYYVFLEDSLMLMGKHTRKRYRMGDRVDVKVLYANPLNRQIDLLPGASDMPEPSAEVKEVAAGLTAPKPAKLKAPRDAITDADAPTTQRALPGRSRRTSGAAARAAAPAAADGSSSGGRSGRRRKGRGERPAPAAEPLAAPKTAAAVAPAVPGLREADGLPASHRVTPRPRPAPGAPRRRLRFAPTHDRA
ncbi:MAG: ribonuclease R [Trueperaceae bacterium]